MTMSKPRLLDLFSGGGGAAMGYHRAGFEVVGVDINPLPRFPFEFHQADALTFPLEGFDAIHASPVCKKYSGMTNCRPGVAAEHPDQIPQIRARLAGKLYVIENVVGAPLDNPIMLCGTMFGLRCNGKEVRRHRLFELGGFSIYLLPTCSHVMPVLAVYGHTGGTPKKGQSPRSLLWERREGMDIPWMNRDEIAESIPPAFTEFIGRQLIEALK